MQINKPILDKQIDKATEYLDEKKNAKAEKFLSKIVLTEPTNDEAWLLLGIAKRRLGELNKAIDCFKAATEYNSSKEEAWGLLTITYLDKGNIEMAKKAIAIAGRLNPNNTKIQFLRHTLVQSYIKHGPFF